ncbi:amino acid transporter [Trematosphaeria pertusa]|uniref:Amino acid transporter n=1 Tax=Trematosphaeria pertusa TaxID=390896 RepID=A0A6A6I548_9PLEO|nr:amino acid transporter [Trematosphaeria pertusa]KAF2245447.1 amino acid transporter [Trematosphaeria pertusa]
MSMYFAHLVLFNGGPTGIITTFPVFFLGVLMQTLVMAELASMIPLSAGQFNWVAILSPPGISNFLSYLTGWIVTIAWQAACAAPTFICSNMIVALASYSNPDYDVKNWHAALIFYAIIALAVLVNTYLGRLFPSIESLAFLLHVVGFFIVLIVVVYLAPKTDPSTVFDNFINGGGFPTTAQSVLVWTQPLTSVSTQEGKKLSIDDRPPERAAEEIENATRVIPRAMIITVVLYFVMGYGIIIMVVFCMSVEEVLTSAYTFPVITVFGQVTKSQNGTVFLTSLIIIMFACGVFGLLATASRMLWAFAREDGVPFSAQVSKIERRTCLPLVSIGTTTFISLILGLIALGSEATFNALSGLTVAGFYSAFIISATVWLWRRVTTPAENLPWGPFRLGKLGVPTILAALVYSWVGLIFAFWPPIAAVTVETFNWSLVVYLGVIFLAIGWWFLRARKTYTGPKTEISSQQWMKLFERTARVN